MILVELKLHSYYDIMILVELKLYSYYDIMILVERDIYRTKAWVTIMSDSHCGSLLQVVKYVA